MLDWISGLGGLDPLAIVAFFLLYAASGVILPLAAILTVTAGAYFGPLGGFALAFPAALVGVWSGFGVTRTSLRHPLERWVQGGAGGRWLTKADAFMRQDGAWTIVILRLIPGIPFGPLNLLCGLAPISWVQYTLASAIGMAGPTLAFVVAGAGLRQAAEASHVTLPTDLLLGLIGIAAFVTFGLVLRRRYLIGR